MLKSSTRRTQQQLSLAGRRPVALYARYLSTSLPKLISQRQRYPLLDGARETCAANGGATSKVRPGIPQHGAQMPRPKSDRHSSDLDAEIARLEQERKRLIQSEDQRRGAIVRELLASPSGSALRTVLQPLVTNRDLFLFALEAHANNAKQSGPRPRASAARPIAESGSPQDTRARFSA